MWKELVNTDQLRQLVKDNASSTIILFKHSPRCSISNMAKDRFERKWKAIPSAEVFLIDVLTARPVSNEIAAITGVLHESPQVLVIRSGKCIFNSSHTAIDPVEVLELVNQS